MTPSAALLPWAEFVLLWMLANYTFPTLTDRPAPWPSVAILRGLTVAAAAIGVVGTGFDGLGLAVVTGLAAWLLHASRPRFHARFGAEWELGWHIAFVVGSAIVAFTSEWSTGQSVIAISDDLNTERTSVVLLTLAAAIFLAQGGSNIVRGVLDKAGSLPTMAAPAGGDRVVDQHEVSRGALIGTLERWLLLVLALAGSYGGIGFVVAAKGLIRSRELANHQYAEYHLVGTLTSTLLALAVGTLLNLAVTPLW